MSVSPRHGSVFLLTDFGTSDEFVGVMKAVLEREAPGVPIVDLSHEVEPFDVRAGALMLARALPHLGAGVVVAVVDPGVGTNRRPVAVSVSNPRGPRFFVGPDNGLFSFALRATGGARDAVELARRKWRPDAGATFDGRDVFAPNAARLWSGVPLSELGSPIRTESLVALDAPRLEVRHGSIETEVLWVDRFGNVQLSADCEDLAAAAIGEDPEVVSGDLTFGARRAESFSCGSGVCLLVDSNAQAALVCERGSAATVLNVRAGSQVVLRNPTAPA